MPTYKVTDPQTGRTVKLTGDSPPTESELNDIFASIANTPSTAQRGGIGDTINRVAETVGGTAMDALSLPFELAGEAVRVPIEQGDGFRAPSIVQRFAPSMRTDEPPSMGFDVANKLVRAGAGAVAGIPSGNPLESARAAYNADRGTLGTAEDAALALLSGKVAPRAASAPVESIAEAVRLGKEGLKATGQGAKWIGKKGVRVATGVDEASQSLRFRNPETVKNAKSFDDLSDEFADTLNNLATKVDDLDDAAWGTLLKLKSEPRSKILDALKQVKKDFAGKGKIGDADKKAVAQIERYIERVKNIRQRGVDPKLDQMLDQGELRNVVQSIRKDARYDLPESDPVNRAVQAAGAKIDALLKTNGNYAEVMKELAPATDTLKKAARHFNMKRYTGVGYVPSNATPSKLSTALNKKKNETKRILDQVRRTTGEDYGEKIAASRAREMFESGDKTRGSARTILGTVVGGTAGGAMGGIGGTGSGAFIGSLLGRAADFYGGPMAGKAIDAARGGSSAIGQLLRSANQTGATTPFQRIIEMLAQNPEIAGPLVAAYPRDR
jgi:hypothetical protein